MIKKVLKYVLNTPLQSLYADLQRYLELRRHCNMAESKSANARCRIISLYDLNAGKARVGCISNTISAEFYLTSSCEPGNILFGYPSEYCGKFQPTDNEGYCDDKNCPFYKRNHQYVDALRQYQKIRDVKKNYWRNLVNERCK